MEPFKLKTVLKYRKQLEDSAKQTYFKALEEEAQALTALREREEELQQLYTTLQQDRDSGTTVTRLILLENRITIVKEQVVAAGKKLDSVRKTLATKKKALIEAAKDRRIMEKMEEKQNEAYKEYLNKKERVLLDELAVIYQKK